MPREQLILINNTHVIKPQWLHLVTNGDLCGLRVAGDATVTWATSSPVLRLEAQRPPSQRPRRDHRLVHRAGRRPELLPVDHRAHPGTRRHPHRHLVPAAACWTVPSTTTVL